jgi:Winged helix-turn-helix DNA-binding
MTREELIQLRDAIDLTLALPDSLRELVAQWLAPAAAKPNGHDHSPPAPPSSPPRVKAQAKRTRKPTPAQGAERKLLAAMRDNPGLSVIALANAAGSSRSATGERLRQMAARGVVEKDLTGRWKLKSEEARTPLPGPIEGPTSPPSH